MQRTTAATPPPETPRSLRPLAKILAGIGFQLAIPFDDIRRPGYVGVYDEGREIILDDGSSLAPYVQLKRRSVAVGDTTRQSRFSLRSFVKTFGRVAGIEVARTKSVTLRFSRRFVPSEYISVTDIVEDVARLPAAYREALSTPGSFVIVQTLETDAIEYRVETKTAIDTAIRRALAEATEGKIATTSGNVEVQYHSEREYSLVLQGRMMTVAYKPYRLRIG
jgi:hypothetical protein